MAISATWMSHQLSPCDAVCTKSHDTQQEFSRLCNSEQHNTNFLLPIASAPTVITQLSKTTQHVDYKKRLWPCVSTTLQGRGARPLPRLRVPRHHARLRAWRGRRRPVAAPHGPQPRGGTGHLGPTAGMNGWEECRASQCHHDKSVALTGGHPLAMPHVGLPQWERPWTAEITSEHKALLVSPLLSIDMKDVEKIEYPSSSQQKMAFSLSDTIRGTYKPRNIRLPRIIWYFTWDKVLQQDWKHWHFLLLWFVFMKIQNPLESQKYKIA